jgi:ATPase subunit of ABC transporter with duplicated ATPase domains
MAGLDSNIEGEARAANRYSRSAICRRNPSSIRRRRCARKSYEGIGGMFAKLERFNAISEQFAEPMSDDEMNKLLEEQAKLQDQIDAAGGWELDRKLEIAADALRLPPWDADDRQTLGRRATSRRAVPLAAVGSPTCCCSTSRPTTSTPNRSPGSSSSCEDYPGTVVAVTHDRYFLDNVAELDPRTRPRPRHSVAGQLLLAGSSRRRSAWQQRRGEQRRHAEDARARARVGAPEPEGAAGQEQGAHAARSRNSHRTSTSSATRPTRSTSRRPSASATW